MYLFRVYPAGNIISSTNGTWDEMIGMTEICSIEEQTLDVLMPWNMDMRDGQQLCEKYWGNMTVINGLKIWDTLLAKNISSTFNKYIRTWTGFSDEDSEGYFVDIVAGSKLKDDSMFAKGQPTGDGNCLFILNGRYYDGDCQWHFPFFCRLRQKPRFQLRGEKAAHFVLQSIKHGTIICYHFGTICSLPFDMDSQKCT